MAWIDVDGDTSSNWTNIIEVFPYAIADIAIADLAICDITVNDIQGDPDRNWADIN